MYVLLSPAKKLNFATAPVEIPESAPVLMEKAQNLIAVMAQKTQDDIAQLMHLSDKLAKLNFDRFQDFSAQEKKQALLAFDGDVYKGLDANSLDEGGLNYAANHVGILSGLYGVLRGNDVMQPYRLEMGTSLKTSLGKNLYEFWANDVTNVVNDFVAIVKAPYILNLASQEYAKVIKKDQLSVPMIEVKFKEIKDGKEPKMIGLYAKRARGMLARYVIDNQITDIEAVKSFDTAGYFFVNRSEQNNEIEFHRIHG